KAIWGLFLAILIFLVAVFVFIPLGQFLGNLFNKSKNTILLYTLNIIASLIGMWSFHLWSWLKLSPLIGIVICQFTLFILVKNKSARFLFTFILLSAVSITNLTSDTSFRDSVKTFWSPYQKLTLIEKRQKEDKFTLEPNGYVLNVNNVGYMGLYDLKPSALKENKKLLMENTGLDNEKIDYLNQYSLPYKFKKNITDVLIIGGGGGNDTAAALRENIPNIDVVEIDPLIIDIGKKYHPEKPYSDKKVNIYINDGRAFFESATKKYDLIIMSLADSHTLSSNLTNLRLDHYLYTLESFQKTKELLKDDGILFVTFEVIKPWIGQRLNQTIQTVYGLPPLTFMVRSNMLFGWGGFVFVTSKNQDVLNSSLAEDKFLSEFVSALRVDFKNEKINLLTDNWPYVYLDKPRLPLLHVLFALIILSLLFTFKDKLFKTKINWQFLFLGAGFLLYEFQNISKSSLLFGATWQTNLYIISGIMAFILMANLAVYYKFINYKYGFIFLFISLFVQFILPLNLFNSLSGISKTLLAVIFLNLPHFFSGVIFIDLFAKSKNKASAFGSNILGSALGGFMEVFSFLFGIKSLIILVLVFYWLGFKIKK
ncbi:hypothetical protein A3J78_01635, partial [Candidatus Beckwithbacteria bacterium RBG_13_35_6]